MPILYFVFLLVAVALVFDFFNGFHDAANSVATVVTTRVLSPLQAVLWAAFFNFVAAFLFGTGVAQTISNRSFRIWPNYRTGDECAPYLSRLKSRWNGR